MRSVSESEIDKSHFLKRIIFGGRASVPFPSENAVAGYFRFADTGLILFGGYTRVSREPDEVALAFVIIRCCAGPSSSYTMESVKFIALG
jgi:hypothetical protein